MHCRAEAHRTYLDNLCYMPPRGDEAIPINELPGSLLEGRETRGPLYVSMGGAMVPLVVFFSPRLRRWVRRIMTLDAIANLWNEVRPRQTRDVSIYGWVQQLGNPSYTKDSRDNIKYDVIFDFAPRAQPWPLAEPTNYL